MTIDKKITRILTLNSEEAKALEKVNTFLILVGNELFNNCDEIASPEGDIVNYEDLRIALNVVQAFYNNGIESYWEDN